MKRPYDDHEALGANPGFAASQVQRALKALRHFPVDETAGERGSRRLTGWLGILSSMLSGSLDIGSRNPKAGVPVWATPEVYAGGFASGTLMAAGPLQAHERQWLVAMGRTDLIEQAKRTAEMAQAALRTFEEESAKSAGNWNRLHEIAGEVRQAIQAAQDAAGPGRAAIHRYLVSEQGLPELIELLANGQYRAQVPEETALLTLALLATHGRERAVRGVLSDIFPHIDLLRFFPRPAAVPRRSEGYALTTLAEARNRWRRMRMRAGQVRLRAVLATCLPLHDRLASLWAETVDVEPPQFSSNARSLIRGGWPCQRFASDWADRARDLKAAIDGSRCAMLGRRWRADSSSPFAWMLEPLPQAILNPRGLSGRQVVRIRTALAQIDAGRGMPGSSRCQALRDIQGKVLAKPTITACRDILERRIEADPDDEGITAERLAILATPISDEEDPDLAGAALPRPLLVKLGRAREGTLQELVKLGLVTSSESLTRLMPDVVARGRAAAWSDPIAGRLAAEAYRCFARRRSLLLLNLESQVHRLEIPWINALEEIRDRPEVGTAAAKDLLGELIALALEAFPHTILPNPFIRQARTLVKDAGLDLPLTEELAADIFMGTFTGQFLAAAQQAAALLDGSIYIRYYGIPIHSIRRMRTDTVRHGRATSAGFDGLCAERVGLRPDNPMRWRSPAVNGQVIEQQQILTTHNLAVLFANLDLDRRLANQLPELPKRCWTWMVQRLSRMPSGWQQRLRETKRMAYAWRQALFFLSRPGAGDPNDFVAWAWSSLAGKPVSWRNALGPLLDGLSATIAGGSPEVDATAVRGQGIRFLGWSSERHWFLQRLFPSEAEGGQP